MLESLKVEVIEACMAWHCMALPDKYLVPMQKDLMERLLIKSMSFI